MLLVINGQGLLINRDKARNIRIEFNKDVKQVKVQLKLLTQFKGRFTTVGTSLHNSNNIVWSTTSYNNNHLPSK